MDILQRTDARNRRDSSRTQVGEPPCVSQCEAEMQSFCARKGISCAAFEYYEETGIAPERSPIGWIV